MNTSRLAQYSLQQYDTRDASDHFPKVTDYSLELTTNIEEETELRDFKLEQNYPNPFNPSTKIKFTIPFTLRGAEGSFVSLKVYDVLGNEIEMLVNEEKPAGSYEIDFSGSDLTSGIYFYQLKYREFVESKKMILLK